MNKIIFSLVLLGISSCVPGDFGGSEKKHPRLVLFVGVDISGSFMRGEYFDDSLDFLAQYLHAHLHGYDDLDVPAALFVGSIGGSKSGEPKTFYPIHSFRDKNIPEIRKTLSEIFPKKKSNRFTDYNAFFEQIAHTVKSKKLILKPISIVMISDGKPDVPNAKGREAYRKIILKPLELLSRNVTVRLLYTSATVGMNWQTNIRRRRVKVWTQDAKVMAHWKDPKILIPKKSPKDQKKFLAWVKDNVDFNVRSTRVD